MNHNSKSRIDNNYVQQLFQIYCESIIYKIFNESIIQVAENNPSVEKSI